MEQIIILIQIFNAFPNGLVIRCVGWKGLSSKHCYLSQRINNLHKITIMTFDMSNTSFCHGFWIDLFRVYKCKETSIRTAVFVLFEYITQPDFHLGETSKLSRRSTGGSVRLSLFLTIETSRNWRELPGRSTSGWVLKPKQNKQTKNKTNKLKQTNKKKTPHFENCVQYYFLLSWWSSIVIFLSSSQNIKCGSASAGRIDEQYHVCSYEES